MDWKTWDFWDSYSYHHLKNMPCTKKHCSFNPHKASIYTCSYILFRYGLLKIKGLINLPRTMLVISHPYYLIARKTTFSLTDSLNLHYYILLLVLFSIIIAQDTLGLNMEPRKLRVILEILLSFGLLNQVYHHTSAKSIKILTYVLKLQYT